MGDMALATTRALARAPDSGDATPRVYTDIASRLLVHLPAWLGQALLGVCVVIAALAFWSASAARRWSALAAPVLTLALSLAFSGAVGFALSIARAGEEYWFAHPEPTRAWTTLTALLAAVLSLLILRVRDPRGAAAAGGFWFALTGFGLSFALPGISILFALPASAFALSALFAFVWRPALPIGAVISSLLALLMWGPTLYLVELALGYGMPYATAALIAVLSFNLLGVLVWAQGEGPWRWPALTLGIGASAAMVLAVLAPSATPARPHPLNIVYFLDVDSGGARFLAGSAERRLPPRLMAAFPFAPQIILPRDRFPYWAAPAPAAEAARPSLEQLSWSDGGGERVVRAQLRMNGAYRALIRVPREAQPLRASINGVEVAFADTGLRDDDEFVSLACQGRSCDGAQVAVTLAMDGQSTPWALIGQTPGAHPAAREAIAARGATATPIQFGDATLTLQQMRVGD